MTALLASQARRVTQRLGRYKVQRISFRCWTLKQNAQSASFTNLPSHREHDDCVVLRGKASWRRRRHGSRFLAPKTRTIASCCAGKCLGPFSAGLRSSSAIVLQPGSLFLRPGSPARTPWPLLRAVSAAPPVFGAARRTRATARRIIHDTDGSGLTSCNLARLLLERVEAVQRLQPRAPPMQPVRAASRQPLVDALASRSLPAVILALGRFARQVSRGTTGIAPFWRDCHVVVFLCDTIQSISGCKVGHRQNCRWRHTGARRPSLRSAGCPRCRVGSR